MLWLKIGERLGMSPSEAKAKHSATDFIRWKARFEDEVNDFHREDYSLAMIAQEVYQLSCIVSSVFGTKLPSRELKDFIPKFQETVVVDPTKLSEEEQDALKKEISQKSRQAWFGSMGLDEHGKLVKRETARTELPGDAAGIPLGTKEGAVLAKSIPNATIPPEMQEEGVKRRIIKPGG